jgi:hypothetical protein
MLLQLQASNTTAAPPPASPCIMEHEGETVSTVEDSTAVNKSTTIAVMDMAEAAWRLGDADRALQLLEENALWRRELFDTSLAS